MTKLSIIIPSRDERFLTPTIDDIFRNASADDTEVIAVLDSDKWPGDWKEVTARHPRLHTIHNGQSIGMRGSINKGVASAISRGAKFIAKFDGHCAFSEGFDEILKADCDSDWIVVPRRGRLDPENWCETELQKPPIDYHYLSFPDDPNDFGGPGLNGKIWPERALARKDILIDDEMSSQGSGWFMHAAYFQQLELMDDANYGPFWCEMQELANKCWLSGGQVKVNKKCTYLHLHKGSKYGRGYRLSESALIQGRNQTMKWIWNEAWDKQTRPFSWLIEHFWPVPTWPENWQEILYAERKLRAVGVIKDQPPIETFSQLRPSLEPIDGEPLNITYARYGILGSQPPFKDHSIDVRERVQSLVKNNSLDIVVNNSTLCPGQNPFRGKKKVLLLTYAWGDRQGATVEREEKDWLIIGQVQRDVPPEWKATAHQRWNVAEARLRDRIDSPEIKYEVYDSVGEDHVHDFQVVEGQSVPQCKCGAVPDYESITNGVNLRGGQGSEKYNLPAAVAVETMDNGLAKAELIESVPNLRPLDVGSKEAAELIANRDGKSQDVQVNIAVTNNTPEQFRQVRQLIAPQTAVALNDFLIRRFSISPQRLRGPMPIELRDFHRNDLAVLFAELGFKRGAEIGVAEGKYSEVLLKANPECELLLVDPWHAYSDNPQNKSAEKNEYAYNETVRKTKDYPSVKLDMRLSMDAVRDVADNSLDFCYIDGHHSYPFVMADIIEWSKKVRSGGIVAGDDVYQLNEKWGAGPMEAVYDYTRAMRINPWWLINAHKSVDFFFVKP